VTVYDIAPQKQAPAWIGVDMAGRKQEETGQVNGTKIEALRKRHFT
jgi:hypothetical protein